MSQQQLDLLNAARITGFMQGITDPRLNPQPLVWQSRIPSVPAEDDEIMARFFGTLLMADLIAEDQRAPVYSMGRYSFDSTKIPKIKVGVAINESLMNQMSRVEQGGATAGEAQTVRQKYNQALNMARFGVELRIEYLKIAMLCDGMTYDRLGIKMTGVTWGMYADLKVTVGTAWSNAGAATPVADIFAIKLVAQRRYGKAFNRITMSTPAFQLMIATAEFQAKSKLLLPQGFDVNNLVLADLETQRKLAQTTLGLQIEFDDRQVHVQGTDGAITSGPMHPINKVVLTNSGDDGNGMVWDFANGVVQESRVAAIAGAASGIVGMAGEVRGPAGYAAARHEPPGIVCYGVARGFTRRKQLQCSAALDIGAVTDPVSTAVVYPPA